MTDNHSIHREVEIKLDADPEFALPDLAGLPGVHAVRSAPVQKLTATYVDTPDLDLVRTGTTFRRRTGGKDAGWHLKLPDGKDGRLEIHADAGKSVRAVPADLSGLVRAQLRGAAVAPVARVATRRTVHELLGDDDRVLAEVADDLVEADQLGDAVVSRSWREIEVELVDGEPALLVAARKLLTKAGARTAAASSKVERALSDRLEALREEQPVAPPDPATAGGVAVAYLAEQLGVVLTQDPRVRMDAEEAVHKMRVATRRLRSALAVTRPLFVEGSVEPLRAELKWLGGVLGDVRDVEVMRRQITDQIAGLPAELALGPVQRRADLHFQAAYTSAHETAVRELDGERYLRVVRALEAFVTDPPLTEAAHRPARDELTKRVRKAVRRLEEAVAAGRGLGGEAHDVSLHEARKAAKRVRYAAEVALPVAKGRAKKVAQVMEAVQETLGDHQDAVVARTWLRELGVQAFLAEENGFSFGVLHGRTLVRAEHDEAEFARIWRKVERTTARWPG